MTFYTPPIGVKTELEMVDEVDVLLENFDKKIEMHTSLKVKKEYMKLY
jgi:hypothetical protein